MLNIQNQNAEPLKLEIPRETIKKRKGHPEINDKIKRNMYAWIKHHPQVVHSSVLNDSLKVTFDYKKEPQLVTNVLLQVSVRERNNRLESDPK